MAPVRASSTTRQLISKPPISRATPLPVREEPSRAASGTAYSAVVPDRYARGMSAAWEAVDPRGHA
jgi:hypothetical protein